MTKESKFVTIHPTFDIPSLVDASKVSGGKAESLTTWDTWKDQIEKINSGEIQSRSAREFLKEMRENDEWNNV